MKEKKRITIREILKLNYFFMILPAFVFYLLVFFSCSKKFTPKPRGYFRIDFPKKEYIKYESNAPYSFYYPHYANIEMDTSYGAESYWLNIDFSGLNGRIHITYKPIENNLLSLLEDTRSFVYTHTIKADAISEKPYLNDMTNVYGILYDIKGNAASSMQFFVTDSIKHFLRGALYFNVRPNKDSLAPVVDFIKPDIEYLMETFNWNK